MYQQDHQAAAPQQQQQQSYRDRITALYGKYDPEKPLSHVDFLLVKYAGYEEDIIQTLVSKYGPEPKAPVRDYLGRVSAILSTQQNTEHSYGDEAAATRATASQLLASHQGMEEHLIYSLMSRFGSEPQTRLDAQHNMSTINNGDSTTLSGSHHYRNSLLGPNQPSTTSRLQQTLDDPEAALRERQDRFQSDLYHIQQEQNKRQAVKMNTSAVELSALSRRQEVELRAMRETLNEVDAIAARAEAEENAQIERCAAQLTKLRLRKLRCESRADPTTVSLRLFEDKTSELKTMSARLDDIHMRTRALEEVLAKHLAMYPTTPVRQALRRADPALAARLDSL